MVMKFNDDGYIAMLKLLKRRPCSTRTVATFCGLYRERAKRLLDLMHKAELIYIEGYYTVGKSMGKWPYYMWKEDAWDKDAPHPSKQTKQQERMRRAALRTKRRHERLKQKEQAA